MKVYNHKRVHLETILNMHILLLKKRLWISGCELSVVILSRSFIIRLVFSEHKLLKNASHYAYFYSCHKNALFSCPGNIYFENVPVLHKTLYIGSSHQTPTVLMLRNILTTNSFIYFLTSVFFINYPKFYLLKLHTIFYECHHFHLLRIASNIFIELNVLLNEYFIEFLK